MYEAIGDHPRVGGEKKLASWSRRPCPGSPPRGRGKVTSSYLWFYELGITPAWAGKRTRQAMRTWDRRDHPRVGGEKQRQAQKTAPEVGSPPRGRGKACSSYTRRGSQRITPAWAGKRLKRSHRSGIFISGPIPFHSVLHRPAGSGGSRAGRDGSPAGQPQNAGPA